MDKKTLMERMVLSVGDVPQQADVLVLRQHTLDELDQRVRRFLALAGKAFDLPLERGDHSVRQDRTVIYLPLGGQAVVYHTSGAMRLVRGLKPMEALFKQIESRERLVEQVEEAFKRLNPSEWIRLNESLTFERLWQIKACALDRKGKAVPPVLCRVVGAYRHSIGGLPVLGPASLALKLAGGGLLDSITLHLRETTGAVLDKARILRPEQAAGQIVARLHLIDVATPRWMRFGYLNLPKRKQQRILAPAYVAAIGIEGRKETQAYLLAVPATEKTYLPLEPHGLEAPPAPSRREPHGLEAPPAPSRRNG